MQINSMPTITGYAAKKPGLLTVPQAISKSSTIMQNLLLNTPQGAAQIAGQLAVSTGKGLRGRLLLICAQDCDGLVPEAAIKAAVAIELLHLATLVHDDVIDDSPTRRGLPTAQSMFGKNQAVIAGDYLFCLALQCVSEDSGQYGRYIRAMSRVCLGELLQGGYKCDLSLSVLQYLRIIEKKTAAFFNLSTLEGAVISGCRDNQVKLLSRIGTWIGLLFQMADDLNDYLLDGTAVPKPVAQDVRCGVVTLPLILALSREPSLASLTGEVMRTGNDVADLIEQVKLHGGVDDALMIALRYRDKALTAVERLENFNQRKELLAFIENISSVLPPCKSYSLRQV